VSGAVPNVVSSPAARTPTQTIKALRRSQKTNGNASNGTKAKRLKCEYATSIPVRVPSAMAGHQRQRPGSVLDECSTQGRLACRRLRTSPRQRASGPMPASLTARKSSQTTTRAGSTAACRRTTSAKYVRSRIHANYMESNMQVRLVHVVTAGQLMSRAVRIHDVRRDAPSVGH
jgi:hypothetical protein